MKQLGARCRAVRKVVRFSRVFNALASDEHLTADSIIEVDEFEKVQLERVQFSRNGWSTTVGLGIGWISNGSSASFRGSSNGTQ
jgi:hypothetical protein